MISLPLWNVETEKGWVTIAAINQDTAKAIVEKSGHVVYSIQFAQEAEC
jgi:hypothetical protein